MIHPQQQLPPTCRRRLLFLVAYLCITLLQNGVHAAITLPADAAAPIRWAAGDVEAALKDAGVTGAESVSVEVQPGGGMGTEGFALTVAGPDVRIVGGDDVGAMYGLLELAEQIRNSGAQGDWNRVAAALSSTTQKPAIPFRADNPFIHATDTSLRFDVPMWKSYIDMLARDRFNVLDLHGAHNLQSTQYPNIYPLLVHVPEYPQVGNAEEQARNTADFGEITAYARSRGVKVALMDYSAEGLAPQGRQAKDYMTRAVATLLKAAPDLSMIGFRIGESGHSSGYLKRAYLNGIRLSGRTDVRLYTRSWLTPQAQVEDIARASGGNCDVEIKYNGEQLGLPYHAIGRNGGSYSFQGYIKPNAPYRIIWQVRANGTHCFWAWEDSDYIRRAVATFGLGRAAGFTLEPHIAYFEYQAAPYYRSPADQEVYHYIWERHWMWYFAWGRLAYNPHLPENTLVSAYERHFGSAGPAVYNALQAAGPIIPLICAYRYQGPDQRQWAPETETGCMVSSDPKWWFQDLATRAKSIGVRGKHPIHAMSFANGPPMDPAAFVPIRTFVQNKIHSVSDGRIGPIYVGEVLAEAARETRKAVAQVGEPIGRAGEEWRLLKVDLLSASSLADYYARRIMGTTHLAYALETGSEPDYATAIKCFDESREAWRSLAAAADAVYGPLNNGMRHEKTYQWTMQISLLNRIDATAPLLWAAVGHHPQAPPLRYTAADRGDDTGISLRGEGVDVTPGKSVKFHCRAAARVGIRSVRLWFRKLPSESNWESKLMTLDGPQYSAEAPAYPEGLIYYFEVTIADGQARNFPNPLEARPYGVIDPWQMLGEPAAPTPG